LHELYTTIGLTYGFILIEDFAQLRVLCMEDSKVALHEAAEREILKPDQVKILETAVIEAGLATDMAGFFQKIKEFVLPTDHKSSFRFQLCGGCANNPLPHGNILTEDGSVVKNLQDVWSGLEFCDKLVEEGKMHALDGAVVLKAVLEANLPTDGDDGRKRYNALPEETRRDYERGRMRVSMGNIPDLFGGSVMVFDTVTDFEDLLFGPRRGNRG